MYFLPLATDAPHSSLLGPIAATTAPMREGAHEIRRRNANERSAFRKTRPRVRIAIHLTTEISIPMMSSWWFLWVAFMVLLFAPRLAETRIRVRQRMPNGASKRKARARTGRLE